MFSVKGYTGLGKISNGQIREEIIIFSVNDSTKQHKQTWERLLPWNRGKKNPKYNVEK